MKIEYSREFQKNYRKRVANNRALKRKFEERLARFVLDSQDPLLRDHQLVGKLSEYRAFWVTGDVRVVYRRVNLLKILFYDIGSHNQVYWLTV